MVTHAGVDQLKTRIATTTGSRCFSVPDSLTRVISGHVSFRGNRLTETKKGPSKAPSWMACSRSYGPPWRHVSPQLMLLSS